MLDNTDPVFVLGLIVLDNTDPVFVLDLLLLDNTDPVFVLDLLCWITLILCLSWTYCVG